MAHKTLIDGTSYEIKGGKTLIDGTAYSIKSGKTLVDGTAYEVGFAKPATITLSFQRGGGGSFSDYARVTIDGVKYPLNENDLTTTAVSVPIGTVITCKIAGGNHSVTSQKITLNGAAVASGNSEYLYTVVGDATIKSTINTSYSPMTGAVAYGTIAITEL